MMIFAHQNKYKSQLDHAGALLDSLKNKHVGSRDEARTVQRIFSCMQDDMLMIKPNSVSGLSALDVNRDFTMMVYLYADQRSTLRPGLVNHMGFLSNAYRHAGHYDAALKLSFYACNLAFDDKNCDSKTAYANFTKSMDLMECARGEVPMKRLLNGLLNADYMPSTFKSTVRGWAGFWPERNADNEAANEAAHQPISQPSRPSVASVKAASKGVNGDIACAMSV